MKTRDQWRAICSQELGKPYVWGAEGPEAYDCSGFTQWALQHLNLDPPGDQTAAGLYRFFSRGRSQPVSLQNSDIGDLIFFGSEEAISHVALVWGGGEMIEAGGGGRRTTSIALARQQNAEVRIRPIADRKDLVAILRPRALVWLSSAKAPSSEVITETVASGRYSYGPPLVEWLDDGRHMRLKRPFGYVDGANLEWLVPAETIVDGASIPQVFWSLVGGPFEGQYRDASIVHDYYCDAKPRPWPKTHRMFYEAMRSSGVSETRAKIMYYAVYRYGPRWTFSPAAMAEGFDMAEPTRSVPTSLPVGTFDSPGFQADAALIRLADLDLIAIEALADARNAGAVSPQVESLGTEIPGSEGLCERGHGTARPHRE